MKRFMIIAVIFGLFLSNLSKARASLHDEALVILEGEDRVSKKPCYLYVLDIMGNPGEIGGSLTVATSYTHNSDSAGLIKVSEIGPGTLTGRSDNGRNQITLFYEGGVFDFNRVTRFNLRWWHVNHAHNYSCINLKVHDHDHDRDDDRDHDHDHDHEHDHEE